MNEVEIENENRIKSSNLVSIEYWLFFHVQHRQLETSQVILSSSFQYEGMFLHLWLVEKIAFFEVGDAPSQRRWATMKMSIED